MKPSVYLKLAKNFVLTHKSEIATGVGIASEAACVALTIKATCNAKDEAARTKAKIDALWKEVEALEKGPECEERQAEVEKEEKKLIRACGRKVAKYYIWTAVTFGLSVGCYIFSVKNGRKELKRVTAALAAEVAANNLRKERAKKILSEDQYNELYYGIKKSGKTREDGKGEEVEQYEYCVPADNNFDNVIGPQKVAVSAHAVVYDKECKEWTRNWDYCRTFIRHVEDWANEQVLINGVVKLNDIRDQFGLPYQDECEDLGIIFNPERAQNQVYFEIFEMDPPGNPYDNPIFLIDINYENIRGRINNAIRILNE